MLLPLTWFSNHRYVLELGMQWIVAQIQELRASEEFGVELEAFLTSRRTGKAALKADRLLQRVPRATSEFLKFDAEVDAGSGNQPNCPAEPYAAGALRSMESNLCSRVDDLRGGCAQVDTDLEILLAGGIPGFAQNQLWTASPPNGRPRDTPVNWVMDLLRYHMLWWGIETINDWAARWLYMGGCWYPTWVIHEGLTAGAQYNFSYPADRFGEYWDGHLISAPMQTFTGSGSPFFNRLPSGWQSTRQPLFGSGVYGRFPAYHYGGAWLLKSSGPEAVIKALRKTLCLDEGNWPMLVTPANPDELANPVTALLYAMGVRHQPLQRLRIGLDPNGNLDHFRVELRTPCSGTPADITANGMVARGGGGVVVDDMDRFRRMSDDHIRLNNHASAKLGRNGRWYFPTEAGCIKRIPAIDVYRHMFPKILRWHATRGFGKEEIGRYATTIEGSLRKHTSAELQLRWFHQLAARMLSKCRSPKEFDRQLSELQRQLTTVLIAWQKSGLASCDFPADFRTAQANVADV